MRALVTGVAGFIGSTLAEHLIARQHEVIGIDALTASYDPTIKRRNLAVLLEESVFRFVEADLVTVGLRELLDGVDVVFHVAALPGVRGSWGDSFPEYEHANVSATQRLLEACREAPLRRFVYSSSSSVYGLAPQFPVRESDLPRPLSPYGVTKLAADHLCQLYGVNFGTPTVSLRYFSVYGPRQRPDMAISRIIEACLSGGEFRLLGTGEQRRDFTFVDDVVRANILAADADVEPGTILNVGTGVSTSLNRVVEHVESIVGRVVRRRGEMEAFGDPERTEGAPTRAAELLGWKPEVALEAGIRAQVEWRRGGDGLTSAADSASDGH
jgi:UDP-glucuronate 4-epimerase